MAHHHDEEFRLQGGEFDELNRKYDRRRFLTKTSLGLGALALGGLWAGTELFGQYKKPNTTSLEADVLAALPHFAPKAKRVVYLFMSGGPSQFETFDYKPKLYNMLGQDLPDSVRGNQRLTGMSASQSRFPIAPSLYKFNAHGQNNTMISELLPHTAKVVDELCIIKSMYTEHINHDPAITFFQTGHQLPVGLRLALG
jgi:hypothetical protein